MPAKRIVKESLDYIQWFQSSKMRNYKAIKVFSDLLTAHGIPSKYAATMAVNSPPCTFAGDYAMSAV